jgi:hypothetical protein
MRPLAAALAYLTVCTAGCGACEPDRAPPPAASATPSTSGAATFPSLSARAAHPTPPKLACRVVALDGEARVEGPGGDAGSAPLLLQGLTPTEAWIALGAGARVVARDPRTTRETTFRGPGRARACVGYTEESWVAGGTFESSPGAGETPGAEEWVVTPSGVVRYTAAQLSVEVKAREAVVTLQGGSAFAWQATTGVSDAGPLDEGWQRLAPGKARLGGRDEPASATLDRCASLAASARSLATQVMAPGGTADAGTITQQVTTRRLARAACAVASVRVNALPSTDAAPLLRPLAEASSAWSTLPVP